ncbi:MAG: type II toxin-antitoxin system RelB/DinJ family antitoxin [Clostridiales bacterium]|nr:type II toxin-antitoxin system RelB/DinJ family antitoxin [Clostridiales bacterium]
MSVQVSTRIDEATKQQFDQICEAIGISPSSALSAFIKSVINHNGIPFSMTAPAAKEAPSPAPGSSVIPVRPPFVYDSLSKMIWMAEDFDAPLEDFKEYME